MLSLIKQLEQDEGKERSAYQDSEGYWTIGVGRLIDARLGGGLSEEEIQYLLNNDIKAAVRTCERLFLKFSSFSQSQQDSLLNMAFNMGYSRMKQFKRMIACINDRDWEGAQREAKDSVWYRQVGARAERVIAGMGQ